MGSSAVPSQDDETRRILGQKYPSSAVRDFGLRIADDALYTALRFLFESKTHFATFLRSSMSFESMGDSIA